MRKNRFTFHLSRFALFAGLTLAAARVSAQFATSVVAYDSGVGFAAGFTNASAALGAPTAGASVTPFAPPFSKTQLVSLGTNGSLTLQFDPPIVRNTSNPFGLDFQIFGNSFFGITNGDFSGGGITSGALGGNNTGQTRVEISGDGTNWFVLNPALAPVVDGAFPTDGLGDPLVPINPALATNDFAGLGLSGIHALCNGSAGGSGYRLTWAQDTNGNPVNVPIARFVRLSVLTGRSEVDAVSAIRGSAIVIAEDFVNNPLTNGWNIFGNTNLFQWNPTNENLAVTWDSSQTNSYFYHPLHTTLGMNDDFSLEFDLKLTDATTQAFGSELAVGFLHYSDATSPAFLRSLGTSPNVAEFDYFPPSQIDASVDATLIDANNNFYFGFNNVTLNAGVLYHIRILHLAGQPGLAGDIFTNGVLYSSLTNTFPSAIGDFQLDTIAVSSYQEDGFGDTILAHGTVGNLVATLPPLVRHFGGEFTNNVWETHFNTYDNAHYALQRSTNVLSWSDATDSTVGTGGKVTLSDTNAVADKAYYRVRAVQP